MPIVRPFTVCCALSLAALAAGAAEPGLPGVGRDQVPLHAVGVIEPPGHVEALPPASALPALPASVATLAPGAPWVAVEVPWETIEPEPGRYDLDGLAARVADLGRRGARVVVAMRGGHPAYGRWGSSGFEAPAGRAGDLTTYRRAWLGVLRQVGRRVVPPAGWVLLEDSLPLPGTPGDAALAEYELKSATVTLRGENPHVGVGVRLADRTALDLLQRAYAAHGDLAPYVDAASLVAAPGEDPAAVATDLRAALVAHDAGCSVWVETAIPADIAPGARDDEAAARAMDVLAGRGDLALVRLASGGAGPSGIAGIAALARVPGPTFGPAPASAAALSVTGSPVPVHWTYFFDEQHGRELIVFWAASAPPPGAVVPLDIETALRREFEVFDPQGRGVDVTRQAEAGAGRARIESSLYRRPLMLTIARRNTGAAPLVAEEAQVQGAHSVTADEIIAAHQAWRAFQDQRLENVERDGTITFRTRFAQMSGTFDITVDAGYLWDRRVGADWTIRNTYLNGVKLTWDKFPEVPFISREQVIALPLALDFDRRYTYELDGEETVDGRGCWRLRFTPVDPNVSLYRGRAWIDQRTAALVKVTTLQTGLKSPLISDEETHLYRPFEGPDGTSYWLLDEIDGQQLYSVTGSNLVVLRAVRFGPPKINAPRFEEERRAAYGSTRQMLRETPEGYKWLTREPDGSRRVLEKGNPRQLFAVAGFFKDESVDKVLPLGGVNYTNVDTWGKGALLNVFFAGPLLNVTLSKPGLFGTRLDGGVQVNAVGFARSDKAYLFAKELKDQAVRIVDQTARVHLGIPLGQFLKVKGTFELSYVNYHRDETTGAFVMPSDTLERVGTLDLTYDRAGWGFLARAGSGHRMTWEPWGPAGALVEGEELDRTRGYRWYALEAQKGIFLPYFQKIDVHATYLAGRDLDRFSAFQFRPFGGARVHGFGGAGIRFDRGLVVSAGYGFNIAEAVRFDATLEHARVHDPGIAPGMSAHTGVGFAGSFLGPWQTILRIDAGYGLRSDLAAAQGGKEITFIALKLF